MKLQWTLCAFVFLLSLTVNAADLDVDSARREFDREQRQAESARRLRDSKKSLLDSANLKFRRAKDAEEKADQHLAFEKSKLTQANRNIESYENDVNNHEARVDRWEDERVTNDRNLDTAKMNRDDAKDKMDDLDDHIDELEHEILELERDNENGQNNTRIASLRQEINTHNNEKRQIQRQYNNFVNQVRNYQNTEDRLRQNIRNEKSNLRATRTKLSQAKRNRDEARFAVTQAERDLSRKSAETDRAEDGVSEANNNYLDAKVTYENEEEEASQAEAYLNQVVANYNAALGRVLTAAKSAAFSDSKKEADKRAPGVGTKAGKASAVQVGLEEGTKDGKKRSGAAGYKFGRENADSIGDLSSVYQTGVGRGKTWALNKADGESFPRGYNDSLDHLVSQAPSGEAFVDISTGISDDQGQGGAFLTTRKKDVERKDAPAISVPNVPGPDVPSASRPSVNVPASNDDFYNDEKPCRSLVLAEFEPKCKAEYRKQYDNGLSAAYKEIFRAEFKVAFEADINREYMKSFNKTQASSENEGKSKGVADQGLLDGFANSIDELHTTRYTAGEDALTQTLSTGYLLLYRSASLTDQNGDGIISPGEKVKLSVVIDNYGAKSSLREKLRLVVDKNSGLKTVNFATRLLPSLAGESRTELQGVFEATVATEFAGEKIEVRAELQVEKNGSFVTLGEVKLNETTSFPLELTSFSIPKNPGVNEEILASLTFKNRTSEAMVASPLKFRSAPKFVEILDEDLEVPALGAGEEATVEVNIKALSFVGNNTYVHFESATKPNDLELEITQKFPQFIKMDRVGSLNLRNQDRSDLPSSKVKIKAGGTFRYGVKYVPNTTTRRQLEVRFERASTSRLTITDGTTRWFPSGSNSESGTRWTSVRASSSLKGTQQWMMYTLRHNGSIVHTLMIYFDVE